MVSRVEMAERWDMATDGSGNPSTGEGIPNSLAIEFDTYQNGGWDNRVPTMSRSRAAAQGKNTSHHSRACCDGDSGPNSTLGFLPVTTPIFADWCAAYGDNHLHSSLQHLRADDCSGNLHVILDNTDLSPSGVAVDLGTLLSLGTAGTAFVGFTAATGGRFETQDILSWTFTPRSQSARGHDGTDRRLQFPMAAPTTTLTITTRMLSARSVTSVTVHSQADPDR